MERILLFDRQDRPLGELSPNDVFSLIRTERVNGEHSLKITTTKVLQKGWRVLVCDSRQRWREFVVYGTDALHDSGEKPFGDYYCVWSLQPDLMGTRISAMPGVQNPCTAAVALAAALGGTARWTVGTVTNQNTGGASMYDTDGWSALSILLANWGGELETTIEVGLGGVTSRSVDLYALQGDQDAKRRFDFGADIKSIRRKIPDGPLYCRITPRGMGEETEEGWGRKITIESVNDGKDWLENPDMVDLAKLPDGNGGWEYPTLEVENGECQTPQELLDWSLPLVDDYTVPKITYEIDVLQLAQEGVDMHGVSLGDAIQAVDRRFGDGLRVSGRVLQTVVNLLDEADMQITVGNIAEDLASMIGSFETRLTAVTDTLTAIAGGTGAADYYSNLLAHLNAQINATGGYTYITEGEGIRCYDHAVTDPTVGAEATKVVEMKGGSIRIANSKTAQGAWEWKTVFVSGKIASDVLSASNITTGALRVQDALGNAVFVADMDAGTVQMAGDAITIGGRIPSVDPNTVWGTVSFESSPWGIHVECPEFTPSDDTVLKLVWNGNATSVGSIVDCYINGSLLPEDMGRKINLADFRSTSDLCCGKMLIVGVEHFDDDNPEKWRWVVYDCVNALQNGGYNIAYGTIEKTGDSQLTIKCPDFVQDGRTALKLQWISETLPDPTPSGLYYRWDLIVNGEAPASGCGNKVEFKYTFPAIEQGKMVVLRKDSLNSDGDWFWYGEALDDLSLEDTRAMFARDTSSVEISAGTVAFKSNTFSVDSDNFSVTPEGVISAVAGTIGGMTIAQNHIYNDSLDLYGQGLDFLYDGDVFGSIQPQYLVDQQGNIYGLINQRVPGAYRFMSKVPNASGSPDLVYEYSREHAEIIGSDTYTNVKGGFNMFGDISMVGDEFFKGKVFFGNTRVDDIFDYGLSTNVYVTYNGHNYLLVFVSGLLTTYTRIS